MIRSILFVTESSSDRELYVHIAKHVIKSKKLTGRQILDSHHCWVLPSGKFAKREDVAKVVNGLNDLARQLRNKSRVSGQDVEIKVIFIRDSDTSCPVDLASNIASCVAGAGPNFIWSVVLPKTEIEAWFLANVPSCPSDVEVLRNPKDHYKRATGELPILDVTAHVSKINVSATEKKCRSFRKFTKELEF